MLKRAGHNNDGAAQVREVLMWDEVIALAMDFASTHPNTLVISVSDHETGGLGLGISDIDDDPVYARSFAFARLLIG